MAVQRPLRTLTTLSRLVTQSIDYEGVRRIRSRDLNGQFQ
jgi:hypothetical protein